MTYQRFGTHRDEAWYWLPPSMPGLSCLHASFTSQHFAPHCHDALVIAVTETGGSTYKSRGPSAEATSNVLLVFNPTEPHAGHMRDSRYWRYRGLYLAERAVRDLLPAIGLTRLPGFTTNAIADPHLISAFADAHRNFDDGDSVLGREQLIAACGHLFVKHSAETTPILDLRRERTQVDEVLQAIRTNFRAPLTVDALAATVDLSLFQLIRQFNRVTGMPPHAHVVRARLHEAICRIRHGTSLADAAVEAGFYDQSALTHHFRRAYGITPGQYARAQRARTFHQD